MFVANQFYLRIKLGPYDDFIKPDDLNKFHLYITSGNLLPWLMLDFNFQDENVWKYINARNDLEIAFGLEKAETTYSNFRITGVFDKSSSNGINHVRLTATLSKKDFQSKAKCNIYENISSLDLYRKLAAENGFIFNTNISATNDVGTWDQVMQSDMRFIDDLIRHSWISDNSFVQAAIDLDTIRFLDLKTQVSNPKWIFSSVRAGNDIITIDEGATINKNTFDQINKAISNKTINEVNSITGKSRVIEYKVKNLTSPMTNLLNMPDNYGHESVTIYTPGTAHENYTQAYYHNTHNNLLMESYYLFVSIGYPQLPKIKVLDGVLYETQDKTDPDYGQAIISGVYYQYENRFLKMNITLNKQAPNLMR